MSPDEKKELHASPTGTLDLTAYDFHAAVRANGQDAVRYDFSSRLGEVARSMERFAWTTVDTATGQIIEEQQGVFRVNCLDWYVPNTTVLTIAWTARITCKMSSRASHYHTSSRRYLHPLFLPRCCGRPTENYGQITEIDYQRSMLGQEPSTLVLRGQARKRSQAC